METNDNLAMCGAWRLVREIGRGAYGVVYLAEGPNGERAAVKVCRREDLGDECYARERRGARLYRSIPPQEGLVRMRDFVEEPWGFYTVMDLADDEFDNPSGSADAYRPKTLERVIEGEKALTLKDCVRVARSLALGLCALQRHHLLHRDIKPNNVIYVGGRPVLSDPGLVVEEADAGSLVGTPGYVPPERFTDAASDVYSLGLTLKAASFGRRVEDLGKGPALEADIGAPFFAAWWRILNKATDPTPSRRYQSAKSLLKDVTGLNRKIAVASIAGSRVAKATAALVILAAAVAFVVSVVGAVHASRQVAERDAELESLRKFKDDFDRNVEEQKEQAKRNAERDAKLEALQKFKDDFDKNLEEQTERAKRDADTTLRSVRQMMEGIRDIPILQ